MKNSNRFYHPLHPNPFPLPAPEITKKSIKDLGYLERARKEERYFAFSLENDTWLKAKPKFVEAGHFIGRLLSELSYDEQEFSDHYFTVGHKLDIWLAGRRSRRMSQLVWQQRRARLAGWISPKSDFKVYSS